MNSPVISPEISTVKNEQRPASDVTNAVGADALRLTTDRESRPFEQPLTEEQRGLVAEGDVEAFTESLSSQQVARIEEVLAATDETRRIALERGKVRRGARAVAFKKGLQNEQRAANQKRDQLIGELVGADPGDKDGNDRIVVWRNFFRSHRSLLGDDEQVVNTPPPQKRWDGYDAQQRAAGAYFDD